MQSELKHPKIVVLGSCCVDFTTYCPRLPMPGETLHGTKFMTSYGGKGANQCVAAAKLGGNTFMISRVGDDQWVAENGENQIVIVAGANNFLSKSDIDLAKDLVKNADVLIAQLETPFETTLEAFKLNTGIKLLNAAPARPDIEAILPYCTILCVNEPEASLIVGFNVEIANVKNALKKILEKGCDTVIITLGEKGAVYSSINSPDCVHVFCEKVIPKDTTGAGDAFVGALATFLMRDKSKPLHQVVGAACEVATLSVTREGTQTSYPENHSAFAEEYTFVIL
ncbi:ribokinase-like isoform X2 [Vanessa cardui]|uniref:ribokinase-like isoform X2 n=1 Tax=Vanessa cardui TaxID=171605 RepID=UPI001F142711|nr:ribokinase-like isoform X2 [Vanessa cardui]